MCAGDRIVFYTDGIIEGESPTNTQYGKKSFYKSIVENAHGSASELNKSLVHDAFSHFKNKPLKDDITLVVVEINARILQKQVETNYPSLDLELNIEDINAEEANIEKEENNFAS